jgi:NADPH2:quinone reductase
MRAVVLDAPGPPEALEIRDLPVPEPRPGWVLIEVKAFGLNRSELHTRLGLASGVTFPRVLGIEATGVVVAAPGGEFEPGQQVAAMMGGMGRTFDGGYAEYTCVPAASVIPFRSELDWATLGAVPEMLQTAYGSLTIGLDAQAGQTLLIRGGTSSVGMATAILAKYRGLTVLSTTRRPDRTGALAAIGVDHALVDDGDLAARFARSSLTASTSRSSSSAPPPCRTRCAPRAFTASCASPACLATSGRFPTSIRSTTCPTGSG